MKKFYVVILLLTFFAPKLSAQSSNWFTLPGSPSNNIKMDDIFFIDSETGWLASGQGQSLLYKTINGGSNWTTLSAPSVFYRCIGFANENIGWAGDLDNATVYRTSNGGSFWSGINISGVTNSGVCGIDVVDSNIVYACGRYYGPSFFYKTSNGGLNWTAQDMSSYATTLVDLYFFNKDTGMVFGSVGTFFSVNNKACILYTTNGGTNWTNVYTSDRGREWGWKLSFLNNTTGYGVIESWRSTDTVGFLKTTNAGLNWNLTRFETGDTNFHAQSILFNNEMTGWIGGYGSAGGGSVLEGKTYETNDGGLTWVGLNFGYNINRFRKVNDSLIYASGKRVYKYSPKFVSAEPVSSIIPESFKVYQNYPNPFNPVTKIKFDITSASKGIVKLKIFNILGREISLLVNEYLTEGTYEINFNAGDIPGGIYFYQLQSGEFSQIRKMILIR
ncbi:MAG: T9SS type A sorting domain-containing protein [Ignavibacteria bacterium]|nr:T9SS type A sorting domain-containing protein [Ignavibacteria bacterium]